MIRLLLVVTGVFVILSIPSVPFWEVYAARVDETQQLEELRDKIKSLKASIDKDRSKRGDFEKKLEILDKEIAQINLDLANTSAQIRGIQNDIQILLEKSQTYAQQLDSQKQRIKELSRALYVMGRQNQLVVFLNQENPATLNRVLGYHDYVVAARGRAIEQINLWVEQARNLQNDLASREQNLQTLEHTQQQQKQQLVGKKDLRSNELIAIKKKITSGENELSKLKNDEKDLQRIISQLQEHLESTKFAAVDAGSFGRMKGKLPLPISAPITTRFGERRISGISWDGIRLSAESGSLVRSIYKGRVVYADWLKGFGLLLILDHGDGYMSLYSHNEVLLKDVGSWVDSGEAISTVGTSGGVEQPTLYFEIRRHGKPINPLAWCKPNQEQAKRG